MRWIEIDAHDLAVTQQGFEVREAGDLLCYSSGELRDATRIEALKDAEYSQLVIVDRRSRAVLFGRDYLGHYPLTFAYWNGRLVISDSYAQVCQRLRRRGARLTLSPEAVALYFSMGFVPHGLSMYREVVNCEATGCYQWDLGKEVRRIDWFAPVPINTSDSIEEVDLAIRTEVDRFCTQAEKIDVWCSGGLDSSVMAMLSCQGAKKADLITLGYGEDIHASFGDGERRYAHEMAAHVCARVRDVNLDAQRFDQFHSLFTRTHNGPVMDFPLPPKYALAQATRDMAITGEAGDTFFGGTKNAAVLFAHHRQPQMRLGLIYALAHHRLFPEVPKILKRGGELSGYVADFCDALVARYPGDLQRKLFYLNTHQKLGSMIFAQSYFPSQLFGVRVRHPMASLGVYRASFALPDHRKFAYPRSKIALMEMYGARLPPSIVHRKKSGTQLPMSYYLSRLAPEKYDLSCLRDSGLFREDFLDRFSSTGALDKVPALLAYACITLNSWIQQKEIDHANPVPAEAGNY